jgi:hypothetical protein
MNGMIGHSKRKKCDIQVNKWRLTMSNHCLSFSAKCSIITSRPNNKQNMRTDWFWTYSCSKSATSQHSWILFVCFLFETRSHNLWSAFRLARKVSSFGRKKQDIFALATTSEKFCISTCDSPFWKGQENLRLLNEITLFDCEHFSLTFDHYFVD